MSNPFDEESDAANENLGPEGNADELKAAKSGGDVESTGDEGEDSGGDVESEPKDDGV